MRNKKSFAMLGAIVVFIIAIVFFFIFAAIFFGGKGKEGLLGKAADAALKVGEAFLPFTPQDEQVVSQEDAEKMQVQKDYVAYLSRQAESSKDKSECLVMLKGWKELKEGSLSIGNRQGKSTFFVEKGAKEVDTGEISDIEAAQKINPIDFGMEFCIIDANNFCNRFDLGGDCSGINSDVADLIKDVPSQIRIDGGKILYNGKEKKYNMDYLFKTKDGKLCFIPVHSFGWPFGCDADAEGNTLDDDCNDNLLKSHGNPNRGVELCT